MADAPRFPAPERREGSSQKVAVPSAEPEGPSRPIVHRPEPTSDDKPARPADPKLTPDEVRALLAVERVTRSRWSRTAIRGGIIVLPTSLLSFVVDLVLGSYAPFVIALTVLGALAWVAWPLLRRDEWS